MRFCTTALLAGGLLLATSAAQAQTVTSPRPVFPSNFSRTFVTPHYGGLSNPSNYGYFNTGSLNHPWSMGTYSSGYADRQPFSTSGYGWSSFPPSYAASPINPGAGLLPSAPGGAVNAPEGTPTLTPGETIRAGSAFSGR